MTKIKVRPEDFIVEELIDIPFSDKGTYTILKLEKRYWNTLDVIDFVVRKTNVSKNLFARAGLKDRYSQSTQYLSFKGYFKHTIKEDNFALKPVGRSNTAVNPGMMRGNSFCITLRSVTGKETETLRRNADEIHEHGFPNYFDEQRFGSARHGQGFIAKKMILEHYQGALKLLMCHAYKEDSTQEKKFKEYCLGHWRDWPGCLKMAPPFYRPILRYLSAYPNDYKNALKKIDREFLNLYLLAYQSSIFNEVLARLVKQHSEKNVSVKYSMGEFIFHRKLRAPLTAADKQIPMINDKTKLAGMVGKYIEKVLAKEGITLKQMALQKMRLRGVRFKYFLRDAIVFPADFTVSKPEPDEIYSDKSKCVVKCILPPGTYATILIKRLLLQR
ncbi:MAG: tRNA pseudouridine(13) synthase TruD [candidate division WOR-3 bacterium]|nr:tRNA pseudouridine(13) synthase TruD [candidate division WOR-3 bacterium]